MHCPSQALIEHSWCGPCHALSPLLERLTTDEKTETLSGRPLDLIKINVDDNDGLTLMQKFKVGSPLPPRMGDHH